MSMEMKCDECGESFNPGDYICCHKCYQGLMNIVRDLKAILQDFEDHGVIILKDDCDEVAHDTETSPSISK